MARSCRGRTRKEQDTACSGHGSRPIRIRVPWQRLTRDERRCDRTANAMFWRGVAAGCLAVPWTAKEELS